MSVHQQYNLVFRVIQTDILGNIPTCDVNQSGMLPHLQSELRSFISRSDDKDGGLVDYMVGEINKILNGTWDGFELEGDTFFVTETNEAIRLDLNDGYAYLGEEDYGWDELPKIPLTDLKAIFEEWISFRDSVYNN